jgi:hypothetical protein
MEHSDIIKQAYIAFNKRNIDAVLKLFHPEVEWPNGWEGGYVHSHGEVREYWTRQWKELDPLVLPVKVKQLDNNRLQVDVKQLVKNMEGQVIADGMVIHTYIFDGDLIKKMIITPGD